MDVFDFRTPAVNWNAAGDSVRRTGRAELAGSCSTYQQARMLRQPGLPRSTKWTDDAWILLVRECHGDGCAMAHASAKNTASPLGSFVPVNAHRLDSLETAKEEASRRLWHPTDQVACRSKLASGKRVENSVPLRHLVRLHMLVLEDTVG